MLRYLAFSPSVNQVFPKGYAVKAKRGRNSTLYGHPYRLIAGFDVLERYHRRYHHQTLLTAIKITSVSNKQLGPQDLTA